MARTRKIGLELIIEIPASLLAAPQGFEPRYADPESAVLPLNEGAVKRCDGQTLLRH
jgi:hypothetical protein